jgi:hypothetical protein
MTAMNDTEFERERLNLFKDNGFQGRSLWLEDPALGIRTYAVARGRGPARPCSCTAAWRMRACGRRSPGIWMGRW